MANPSTCDSKPVSVTFIGTGDAFNSGGRRSSSYLVTAGDTRLVIDCGPTTPHGLKALGEDPGRVNAVLQTHFHGDHVLGLPMMLLHHQIQGGPPGGLTVVGPPELERLALEIYGLVYGRSAEKLKEKPEVARFVQARIGDSITLGDIAIQVHGVTHNPESIGYRICAYGRVLAFTGDTKWDDRLTALAEGSDLLVIDCTWLGDPIGDHLSYREIHEKRARLPSKRIVLSHFGPDMAGTPEKLELERAFDGMVVHF